MPLLAPDSRAMARESGASSSTPATCVPYGHLGWRNNPEDAAVKGTTRSSPQRLVALLASLMVFASCVSDTDGDQREGGRNEFPTPEVGDTRLAYLDDGTPIWLVHPDAGDPVAVAALAPAGPELSSQLGDVQVAVTWNEVMEQFVAGSVWDATGRAIGFVRDEMSAEEERRVRDLDRFAVERSSDGQLIVGAREQGEDRVVPPLLGIDASEALGSIDASPDRDCFPTGSGRR